MTASLGLFLRSCGVRPKGVIHLGAHVGQELPDYQAWEVPVIWVEANPELIPELRKNVSGYVGHLVVAAAVSDRRGYAPFYVASNGGSSSLLPMKQHRDHYPEVQVDKEITVLTTTVDQIMRDYFLAPDRYDFLSMDLQGAEEKAIAGMEIQLQSLRWIYSEVNLEELYEGCMLFEEFSRLLETRGFFLGAFRDPEPGKGWAEALYVRR